MSRCVKSELRTDFANQPRGTEILYQNSVHTCEAESAYDAFELRQLGCEHQSVQGYVAANTAEVQVIHRFIQLRLGEVSGASTCVEPAVQSEIDRILRRSLRPLAGTSCPLPEKAVLPAQLSLQHPALEFAPWQIAAL